MVADLRSRKLVMYGLGLSFVMVVLLMLVLAGSAVAGPQVESTAYLPYETGFPEVEPVDSHETSFSDGIDPWKEVRRRQWGYGSAI